jgi:phosphatidate cytidylyltransferase
VVIGSFVLEGGECFFWLIMLGTWASDTFAYFVGCAIGKRKLCPNVSPNKSVEGAAAGFIGCLAIMVYLGVKVLDMEIAQAAALGLCVAVFAPLGDLVESILKRSFGVKDSGKIFPGHGGVLDRCDSLLFAIPLGYYVLVFSVLLTKTH